MACSGTGIHPTIIWMEGKWSDKPADLGAQGMFSHFIKGPQKIANQLP